ncbi:MAG TPA: hypothetical protein VNO21_25940 [Polyangiaceae bacterium]|nr:hypothetical protein [Polyangiaceae bacterium]
MMNSFRRIAMIVWALGGLVCITCKPSDAPTEDDPTIQAPTTLETVAVGPRYQFGVLKADDKHLATDYDAGVRLAVIGVYWADYEPTENGGFDAAYRSKQVALVSKYRNAGYKVSLAAHLGKPPAWLSGNPAMQHHSQFALVDAGAGLSYSGLPNIEFRQSVRVRAARFIGDVVGHMGTVDDYRVGLEATDEIGYPHTKHGEWWAFDDAAQGRDTGDLPPGAKPNPYPGWIPGQSIYQGRSFAPADAKAWYDWYFGAMVAAHDWVIRAHRNAGFQGIIQLPTPGVGVSPVLYRARINELLAPDSTKDPLGMMNTGAVRYLFFNQLQERAHLMLDISSVYDTSGHPRGNHCQVGDDEADFLGDPSIAANWSSTRWLALMGRQSGFPLIGENPGYDDAATMHQATALMKACNLQGLQWAFDDQLYAADGGFATISDYAATIDAYNAPK